MGESAQPAVNCVLETGGGHRTMAMHGADGGRIERRSFTFLREAKRQSEALKLKHVDPAAGSALQNAREVYTLFGKVTPSGVHRASHWPAAPTGAGWRPRSTATRGPALSVWP